MIYKHETYSIWIISLCSLPDSNHISSCTSSYDASFLQSRVVWFYNELKIKNNSRVVVIYDYPPGGAEKFGYISPEINTQKLSIILGWSEEVVPLRFVSRKAEDLWLPLRSTLDWNGTLWLTDTNISGW